LDPRPERRPGSATQLVSELDQLDFRLTSVGRSSGRQRWVVYGFCLLGVVGFLLLLLLGELLLRRLPDDTASSPDPAAKTDPPGVPEAKKTPALDTRDVLAAIA